VVARWFGAKRRPTAMSIAATGNSFGAIVLTPPAVLLIAAIGLDAASPWLALALLLGVLPPAWLVVRSWPREIGLAPLGEDADDRAPADDGAARAAFARALRSRYFWAANIAFLLGMAAHVGGQTHLFNLLMLREDDAARAGAAIALMAGASVLSRVVAVWLLARMSSRAFVMLLLGVQGGALAAIGSVEADWLLYPAIALYGTTLGNLVTAQSLLLVEGFGIAAYARIYGLSRVVGTAGVVFGPGLMGLSYVAQQSYVGAFVGIGLVSVAGIAALAVSGRPG
jgi:hypothetical protein